MATQRFSFPAAVVVLLLMMAMISGHVLGGGVASSMRWRHRVAHLEPVDAGGYRTYIVILRRPSAAEVKDDDDEAAHRAWHQSFLPSRTTSLGQSRLRWSYRKVMNGFGARLTEEELKEVSRKPGFVYAWPNSIILYKQKIK